LRIAVGSDHAGFELKQEITRLLQAGGHEAVDVGAHVYDAADDYPDNVWVHRSDGSRTRVGLGDRWFDDFLPLVRGLERDIEVDDEVSRRLTRLRPAPTVEPGALTRADVADICHELTDLAAGVADEALRERIERLRARVEGPSRRSTAPTVDLAPRELAVLEQVAAGCSNREAADNLGLLTSTVKSYLKTAMRKLHASNRVQAIIAAREAGLLT
jgi:LuxR family transcriptional regulator, regulator of acetate metabolism